MLLRDIRQQAEPIIAEHHATNRICLKLSSTDGYLSVFSWHEIHNSAVGEKAMVVFERDAQPLGEDEPISTPMAYADRCAAGLFHRLLPGLFERKGIDELALGIEGLEGQAIRIEVDHLKELLAGYRLGEQLHVLIAYRIGLGATDRNYVHGALFMVCDPPIIPQLVGSAIRVVVSL